MVLSFWARGGSFLEPYHFNKKPTNQQQQHRQQNTPISTRTNQQSLLWDSEHQQQQHQNGVHFNHGGGGGGVNVISGTGTSAASPRKFSGSLHGNRTMSPPPTIPKRSSFNNLQSHPNHLHHHQQHHSKGPRRHSTLSQMLVITHLNIK